MTSVPQEPQAKVSVLPEPPEGCYYEEDDVSVLEANVKEDVVSVVQVARIRVDEVMFKDVFIVLTQARIPLVITVRLYCQSTQQ